MTSKTKLASLEKRIKQRREQQSSEMFFLENGKYYRTVNGERQYINPATIDSDALVIQFVRYDQKGAESEV